MPIAPIWMTPAYRYGQATPWGGDGLKRLFGRDIPDEHTGESLEVSAIPGLESRDETGAPLSALIVRYGERLTGPGLAHPFPLLLKLLDARDTLSVQVHPDDAYAARVEHKLGKTEVWHILRAEPGAQLVYGVKKGVTREALQAAAQSGPAVEDLLRRVPVRAGETYYIPAGTVHAIGAGILLYEIQQSSDVTYRFYDWERTDARGNKRELRIQKAVDVTDVSVQREQARPVTVETGRERLLDEAHFSLDRLTDFDGVLTADPRRFELLTAVEPCRLSWEEGERTLPAGRTALLPADGFDLHIQASQALLACPATR